MSFAYTLSQLLEFFLSFIHCFLACLILNLDKKKKKKKKKNTLLDTTAANPAAAQAQFPPGSCYNCGDLTHYRNNCPRLVNANPARG
ncbi:putative transcription factor interactor and regulator CCHC(Zn) family [Helianthus annuus]|nr:putative transcription factor interactor and regulator CCHC(Zn) family [Helianthus annuus]